MTYVRPINIGDSRVKCSDKRQSIISYTIGKLEPHYPMPAIRYQVEYQIGDGDYWCGIYNQHLEEHDPFHDDCFVMLWNVWDNDDYVDVNREHLFGILR